MRRVLILIAAVAALALAAPAGAAPSPGPGSLFLKDLKPCERRYVPKGMLCGRVRLPYEAADPSLGTVGIAFGVLPRQDRSHPARGAVIGIEGGPGYGSVTSAGTYKTLLGDQLRHRDLLVVDAPGTGASRALDCNLLQSGHADNQVGLASCARSQGERFQSFRTQVAVDNIDTIRKALGYDDVQVYGDSYGTFSAQAYAFRHSDGLSALVLDSAYPVTGESPWYPSVWRTGVRGLSISCRRSPDCRGDAGARLSKFVRILRKTKLGVGPLLNRLGSAGFSPPESYLKIDDAISAYLRGNETPYEELTKPGRVGYGKAGAYSRGEELAVSCNDYPMIWDTDASQEERYAQLQERVNAYPKDAFEPFTPTEVALQNDVLYLECLAAPRPNANYQPPVPANAPAPEAPVLVISGELDNVTSPAEGRAAAALFPDSRVYVFPNGGHVASEYGANNPGAIRIRKFLAKHE